MQPQSKPRSPLVMLVKSPKIVETSTPEPMALEFPSFTLLDTVQIVGSQPFDDQLSKKRHDVDMRGPTRVNASDLLTLEPRRCDPLAAHVSGLRHRVWDTLP